MGYPPLYNRSRVNKGKRVCGLPLLFCANSQHTHTDAAVKKESHGGRRDRDWVRWFSREEAKGERGEWRLSFHPLPRNRWCRQGPSWHLGGYPRLVLRNQPNVARFVFLSIPFSSSFQKPSLFLIFARSQTEIFELADFYVFRVLWGLCFCEGALIWLFCISYI